MSYVKLLLPLFLSFVSECVCVCVSTSTRSCAGVCICVCVNVRTSLCFLFYFISNCCLSLPCLASSFQLSGSCAPPSPAAPLFFLRSFGPFCLSPSHTYLTRLMCFKFNFFFRVLPHCICLF